VDVKAFRLVVADSNERCIVERAVAKRGLDRAVLDGHRPAHELEHLLRLGACHALSDGGRCNDGDDKEQIITRSRRLREDEHVPADVNAVDFWKRFTPPGAPEPPVPDGAEGEPDDELEAQPCSYAAFQAVLANLLKFGYGRWRDIAAAAERADRASARACDTRVDARGVREPHRTLRALHMAITWRKFERIETRMQRNQMELEAVAVAKATQRLRKLDMLAHLHRVVATCLGARLSYRT
jgi:hypothetical protein